MSNFRLKDYFVQKFWLWKMYRALPHYEKWSLQGQSDPVDEWIHFVSQSRRTPPTLPLTSNWVLFPGCWVAYGFKRRTVWGLTIAGLLTPTGPNTMACVAKLIAKVERTKSYVCIISSFLFFFFQSSNNCDFITHHPISELTWVFVRTSVLKVRNRFETYIFSI